MESDVRTRMLEAAGEIFAAKGFSAATVREICTAAGVNIAAVNYYFGDKMGLYVESVKHAHACGHQLVPQQWPAGVPARDKLHDVVSGMMRHLLDPTQPAWKAKLMMRELAEPTEACQAIVEQYIRPKATVLQEVIRELLPASTDAERIPMILFSVVGQCLFYRVHEPVLKHLLGESKFASLTPERIAEHIVSFTLQALRPDAVMAPARFAERTR